MTPEDKKEFCKRVVNLVETSIDEHESLVDGLSVEVVDWFYELLDVVTR